MNRSIPNSQGLNLPTDIHPLRSPIVPITRSERYAPSNHGWSPPTAREPAYPLSIKAYLSYDLALDWHWGR